MLIVTAVALGGLPLWVTLAALADLVRGRRRFPTVRVLLFMMQYLINDSVEIVAVPLLWLRAGAGTTLSSRQSIERHERLQMWSARLMADRADQLLSLRIDPDDEAIAALTPGPVIVVSRHVSILDASLPGLLADAAGLKVRGVLMAELLNDPGFDILYQRLGSVFIEREGGPETRAAVEKMAADAGPGTAHVIFPEGRLFTKQALDRSMAKLEERDPERACRLAGLRHVLPPRLGGFVTLLEAMPDADVVLIDHRGLDGLSSLGPLLKRVPAREPVAVTIERIRRLDVPNTSAARTAWLDQKWLELDRALRIEHDNG